MTSTLEASRSGEAGEAADIGSFADRLNRLFATVYPPGGDPYTSQQMVLALRTRGHRISAPYLSQLRTGERTRPSEQTVSIIAEFFGVSSKYFTDPDSPYACQVDSELRWRELAQNPVVRRLTTMLLDLDADTRDRLMADAGI